MIKPSLRTLLAALATMFSLGAHAAGTVGNSLPADFPVIIDTSLGKPVIGFGAAGAVKRTPVIFLHGGPGGYVHSAVIRVLAPLTADGRDLYFYDQSGTGLSDQRRRRIRGISSEPGGFPQP